MEDLFEVCSSSTETMVNTTELVTSKASMMENCLPAKQSKLSMSLKKGKEKKARETTTLQDHTNQDTGGNRRFSIPVSYPKCKKASKGIVPTKTEASSQRVLRTSMSGLTTIPCSSQMTLCQ